MTSVHAHPLANSACSFDFSSFLNKQLYQSGLEWSSTLRPACLIYSSKSPAPFLKCNPPYPHCSQILYRTKWQPISYIRWGFGGLGVGESAVDSCCGCKQARAGKQSLWVTWELGPRVSRRRIEEEDKCCLAPVPRCTVLCCVCLCCRLVKNVSWPLCQIPGGVIGPFSRYPG